MDEQLEIIFLTSKDRMKYLKSMNLITLIGIIIIAIGTGLTYWGSSIGASKDKGEITSKIDDFKKSLEAITQDKTNGSKSERIDSLKTEFEIWADSFSKNKESLKVDYDKAEIGLRERKIRLNSEWHKVYFEFFNSIREIVFAYNKVSQDKKVIIHSEKIFPDDIFKAFPSKFELVLKFDEQHYWAISLVVSDPVQSDEIPSIIINTLKEPTPLLSRLGELTLRLNLEHQKINIWTMSIFAKMNLDENYPLTKDSKQLIEIFKRAFEYQILMLR